MYDIRINGGGYKEANHRMDEVLSLQAFSSSWGGNNFSLVDINLKVKKGKLIAVVGPVACGKTTLLMSLLKELDYSGQIFIDGKVGFSSQVPWIFNGSIIENILFNRPYEEDKLNKCIESCYLVEDLKLLPHGLHTIVGERGVQLSGGQKARVNLARAIYGDEAVVLLDDPLSAVDTKCANHIFNRVIKEQLRDKTRILVTHTTQFLGQVDRVVLMKADVADDGKVAGGIRQIGTYTEMMSAESAFLFTENVKSSEGDKLTQLCEVEPNEDPEIIRDRSLPNKYEEDKNIGSMRKMIYIEYVTLRMGFISIPLLLLAIIAPVAIKIRQEQFAIDWLKQGA